MRSDLKNDLALAQSLKATNQADPAVPVNGTGVDLAGYDAAVVCIDAGAITGAGASLTFEVQHSDDNVAFTAVPAADLDGTAPVVTSANHNQVFKIGYRGIKRYLRVSITAKAGTTPTMACAAAVVRGKPRVRPAA
ncbi:hypothetical protein O7630_34495 [Micromonospora sp. WMMD718]|uniref:hypothetical protein n=1 Tax=Micromonospora sp. WMMD718 TaxID=3016098 RepID=UPI0024165898|nr:hypothetical protein [Micromonospora sp. WMMD718]MDG4756056.1 hypothetical protein [Micromonospora sp. WMMD718]